MAQLSFASYGRKGNGVNPLHGKPPRRPPSRTPTLPWSPLKAGDTVSLIRYGRVCLPSCGCGDYSQSSVVSVDTIYAVVIDRFWHDPAVASSSVYVVENLEGANYAIRRAANTGPDDSVNQNCPYGTSVGHPVCRSDVFQFSNTGSNHGVNSTHFLRKSCKVIVINENRGNFGEELRGDRHGYL